MRLLSSLLFIGAVLVPFGAFAQDSVDTAGFAQTVTSRRTLPLRAVVSGPQDVPIGRTIVLEASSSQTPTDDVLYEWFVQGQEQPISTSVEALYTPEKTGPILFRLVMTATVNGDQVRSEDTHIVNAYRRKVVLITDTASMPDEKLAFHQQTARQNDVYLRILRAESSDAYGAEELLSSLISEESSVLNGASPIVVWTEGIEGMQALVRATSTLPTLIDTLQTQSIFLITDRGLSTVERSIRGSFAVLSPRRVLLTRKESINVLLSTDNVEDIPATLQRADIDFLTLSDSDLSVRPWNILSSLVNAMLMRGIPSQTVILLLVLPVIATILAFFKQIVGITTFGLYTPSIIALGFLALGVVEGLIFLGCILFASYGVRSIMRRWRLLYIPKVALVIVAVSLFLLLLTAAGSTFGLELTRDTVFILLILSTLAESFLTLKTEQGWYWAFMGIAETVGASLVCVFIVQLAVVQAMLLAYPELLLLTIPVNIFLGRWTGLRLTEYFRFREVFRHMKEE